MAERGRFAHYSIRITRILASAPLRSLSRPSMAALLTLSQRSLRFESPASKYKRLLKSTFISAAFSHLWRRGGDSNSRSLAGQQISSLSPSASRTPLRKSNFVFSGSFFLFSQLFKKATQLSTTFFLKDSFSNFNFMIEAFIF